MEWIKCSDRMPEINIEVLMLTEAGYYFIAEINANKEWITSEVGEVKCGHCVTYWMPLPQPPE